MKINFNTTFKLMVGLILTSIIIFVSFFVFLNPIINNTIDDLVKSRTKANVEIAYDIVNNHYAKFKTGIYKEDEAKRFALECLRKIRFSGDGYFWVNDYNHKMIMHPTTPEFENRNLKDYKDPFGVKLFDEFVKTAKSKNEGFVYYAWQRPGDSISLPKVSYVKGFKEWNWIIGSGTYIEDINLVKSQIFISIVTLFIVLLASTLAIMIYLTNRKQVEKVLRENEENLRTTLDSIGEAVIATDVDGFITRINPVALSLTGWEKKDAIGKPLTEVFKIVNSQSNKMVDNPVQRVLETGKIVGLANHTILLSKSGIEYQISDSAAPIYNTKNKIVGVVLVFRDVTEKYASEKAIKDNEERFEIFFSMASEGLLIHDNGIILDANQALIDLICVNSIDDIKGKFGVDIVPFCPESKLLILESLKNGSDDIIDAKLVFPDGKIKYVETQGKEFSYKSGKANLVYMRDITSRKVIENQIIELNNDLENKVVLRTEELKNAMDNYLNIFMKSPVGIFRSSLDGSILIANPKCYEMFGYTQLDDLQNVNLERDMYVNSDDRNKYIQTIRSNGYANNYETVFYKKDKSEIHVSINSNVVRDEKGNVLYLEGSLVDITDKKLQELENLKLSKAVEHSPTSIVITDNKGKIIYVNRMFLTLTGYDYEECIGQNPRILKTNKTDKKVYTDLWNTIIHGGTWRGEFINKKKNGEEFIEKATVAPIFNENGNIVNFVAIKEDITHLKKTELIFREMNEKQKILINNLPAYIYFKDRNLRYQLVNKPFSILLNKPLSQIIGKSDTELGLGDKYEKYDLELIKGKSSIVMYEDKINTIFNKEMWTSTTKVIYGDIVENDFGIIGIVHDITEKKLAEEEILTLNENLRITNEELELTLFDRNQLVQNLTDINDELDNSKKELSELNLHLEQKVLERTIELEKSLSELIIAKEKAEESNNLKSAFLANMTHEIKTPLNEIIGFTKFISLPEINEEDRQECQLMISQSSNRLIELINNVLEISLIDTAQVIIKYNPINLNDLLSGVYVKHSVLAELKNLDLKLDLQVADENSLFYSDDYRISQVLDILLNNSIKFTHKGYIEFGYEIFQENIQFYVKDTGIGIPANRFDSIFAKFTQSETSLSRSYEGAGLGLSLAKGIVGLMNGNIWAESKEGEGSTFYFTIPMIKDVE